MTQAARPHSTRKRNQADHLDLTTRLVVDTQASDRPEAVGTPSFEFIAYMPFTQS